MRFELKVTKNGEEVFDKVFNTKYEACIWLKDFLKHNYPSGKRYSTTTIYHLMFPSKTKTFELELQ